MAAAAQIVDGTELNQQAAITTDNFPGIYWGKRCSHQVLGVARAGYPGTNHPVKRTKLGTWFQTWYAICGTIPVEVK